MNWPLCLTPYHRRPVAQLISDDSGLFIRFLKDGHVVQLAGNPKQNLTVDTDDVPDDPGERVGVERLEAASGERLVHRVLLDARLHEGGEFVLKVSAHKCSDPLTGGVAA